MASETQVTDAIKEKVKHLNACSEMLKNLRGMLAVTVSHSIIHQQSFVRETQMVDKVREIDRILNLSVNELIESMDD